MIPYDETKCTGRLFKGYSGCCCQYCTKYSNQKGKWILNILGGPNRGHEIALVRETNRHGLASWGWSNQNKVIVSTNNSTIPKEVFDAIVKTAQSLVNKKNKKENLR